MGTLANNNTFQGDINNAVRQATLAAGVSATLQILTKDAAGATTWVNVPDGALSGATNVTFYAIPNQTYRFTSMTGGVVWLS